MKFDCECLYCGAKWQDQESYSWSQKTHLCNKCGEKKNILVKKIQNERSDVYGYRFSPDFPPKQPVVEVKEEPKIDRMDDNYGWILD